MSVNKCFINDLPQDIYYELLPYLSKEDQISLRCTSKSAKDIKDLSRKVFEEHFGAIATCDTDINKLIAHYKSAEKIKKKIDISEPLIEQSKRWFEEGRKAKEAINKKLENNFYLDIDENGNLVLIEFEAKLKKLSFFKRIKAKFNFYLGEHNKKVLEAIHGTFEHHVKVAKEFVGNHLDYKTNNSALTKFRAQLVRINAMKDAERTLVFALTSSKNTYNKFIDKLNCFEKLIYRIVAWFNSKPIFNIGKFPTQASWEEIFHSCNEKGVKIGETQYESEDTAHKVDIVAGYTGSGKGTLIMIKENGKIRESVRLTREFYPTFKFHLEAAQDSFHTGFQDPKTGDLPLKRILLKTVVEIFKRESQTTLVFKGTEQDADVFIAGGFRGFIWKRALAEIQESRVSGQLFPKGRPQNTCYPLNINKFDSEKDGTHFHATIEDSPPHNEPAFVDLVQGQKPIKWEEEIRERPVLFGSESVMLPSIQF